MAKPDYEKKYLKQKEKTKLLEARLKNIEKVIRKKKEGYSDAAIQAEELTAMQEKWQKEIQELKEKQKEYDVLISQLRVLRKQLK